MPLLRVAVSAGPRGERRIDFGANVPGSIEAGLRLAEIRLGGLGHVTLWPTRLSRAGRGGSSCARRGRLDPTRLDASFD